MMKLNGLLVVTEVIGQQCQRQLRRAAAAVAPLKSGRTVIPQIQPGIERTAIDGHVCDITLTAANVAPHDAPGFPAFRGVIFWQDFVTWRTARNASPVESLPKLNGVAPANPANFPPRAAKILLEA